MAGVGLDVDSQPDRFWKGRKVLITGHTGFKGSWLSYWLAQKGAVVAGMALNPTKEQRLFDQLRLSERLVRDFRVDMTGTVGVTAAFDEFRPEVVFHLAAQALVRDGYRDPLTTISTNVMGTVNLLEALRTQNIPATLVNVTTDKVYKNEEWPYPYRENDPLGGLDPYSASKSVSELLTDSYFASFLKSAGLGVATARAGNVVGGGDWSRERLIPDLVAAWGENRIVEIRNPKSYRPWQHVLESLHGYMLLAERLSAEQSLSGAYNFGPDHDAIYSVEEVASLARSSWAGQALWSIHSDNRFPESNVLAIENAKAKKTLGWRPVWNVEIAIRKSVQWYQNYLAGHTASDLCAQDISDFEASLGSIGIQP